MLHNETIVEDSGQPDPQVWEAPQPSAWEE